MRSCFLQLIKKKSRTNKKTDKIKYDIFYKLLKSHGVYPEFILGRISEDPNLPIDDRRKIKLPYNDETLMNNRRNLR